MGPSDDVSVANEGCGVSSGTNTGRQENGVEEVCVPPVVVAAKAFSAAEIVPDYEHDHNSDTETAGADSVTRDDGENGVGSLLESSTMEPVRLKIDEFPENTQETPQGSENSTSVVAPRLAQSEPEVENSRGSDAPEVAVKPLAVEPTRVSGSSRSQHVGKDGYSTVLGELKDCLLYTSPSPRD